ncbi:MAG: hypothetical protein ISF22_06525 [Methanomassiliicoccus sp.]|nr:hypothetical protein [Methanomassiliicoccus sp.]
MSDHASGRRLLVVLNPRAGIGSAHYLRERILDELRGLDARLHYITEGEDLRRVIGEALEAGVTEVVAAGGDGTVSSVAGALAMKDATLGIIPTGTANMLARELGIPLSVTLAARTIKKREHIVRLDTMSAGDRHFVYQVVVGAGAEWTSDITKAEKELLGRSVYALARLRLLTDHRPLRVTLTIDGRRECMWVNQLFITNAGILGTDPLRLGRGIRPDDGKIEVIAMRGRTRMEYIESGLDMMLGNFGGPGLRYFDARKEIVLTTEPETVIKADGEFIGNTPLKLKVLPGAVRVIAPGRP